MAMNFVQPPETVPGGDRLNPIPVNNWDDENEDKPPKCESIVWASNAPLFFLCIALMGLNFAIFMAVEDVRDANDVGELKECEAMIRAIAGHGTICLFITLTTAVAFMTHFDRHHPVLCLTAMIWLSIFTWAMFSIMTSIWLTQHEADDCVNYTSTSTGLKITSNQHLRKMVIADTVLSFIAAWPACMCYSGYFFNRFVMTEQLGEEDLKPQHVGKHFFS